MSNYIKLVNYSVKDVLPTGNANKIIRGTELDAEFAAIAANMATKAESNNGQFTNTTLSGTTLNGNTTINGNTVVNGSVYFSTASGGSFSFDNATFNNITINSGFIDNVQIGLIQPASGAFNSISSVLLQSDNAILVNGTVTGSFNVPTPLVASEAANKGYVDAAVAGFSQNNVFTFVTFANALAAIGTIPLNGMALVLVDETKNNSVAYYQNVAGVLTFVSFGDYYVSPVPYIQSADVQEMITKLLVKTGAIPGVTGVLEADFTNLSY